MCLLKEKEIALSLKHFLFILLETIVFTLPAGVDRSSSWCRFLENPKEKYLFLPHGKSLADKDLQITIRHIMETYESLLRSWQLREHPRK
jgi:hypothetical protein